MSVTFTAELAEPIGYLVYCCPSAKEAAEMAESAFATYEEAYALLVAEKRGEVARKVLPGCEDPEMCLAMPRMTYGVQADPAPEINMSNSNAGELLVALQFGEDVAAGELCGTLAPEAFLGRVLMALAAPEDPGVPAEEVLGSGGRFIECGRPPGYVQERLDQLHDLARWCQQRQRQVQWA